MTETTIHNPTKVTTRLQPRVEIFYRLFFLLSIAIPYQGPTDVVSDFLSISRTELSYRNHSNTVQHEINEGPFNSVHSVWPLWT